jgi:hypothetical protein
MAGGGGVIVVMMYYCPGKYKSQYHPDINYERGMQDRHIANFTIAC